MKALYVYNQYSNSEMANLDRANSEIGYVIDFIEVNALPEILKNYVRATPALLVFSDDLQGANLLGEGVDGNLLVTAMLYKRMEEEELAIHQAATNRLDNMIRIETIKAQDALMDDLIERGVL